jgi:tetratricopeptide (TPR) repeat protein
MLIPLQRLLHQHKSMFTVLPFLLILISLTVIILLIVKKFPNLTLLDIDSIPEVQEEKKKDAVLKKRVAQAVKSDSVKRGYETMSRAGTTIWKTVQTKFRDQARQLQTKALVARQQRAASVSDQAGTREKISEFLTHGNGALERGELDKAEAAYINIVRLDPKNFDAYQGLIDVYTKQGQTVEAIETCTYMLQLYPDDAKIHLKMASLADEKEDVDAAIAHTKKSISLSDASAKPHALLAQLLKKQEKYEDAFHAIAESLERQPENPRYLDSAVELAILCQQKNVAQELWNRLRMANPDNQKLDALKQRISEL